LFAPKPVSGRVLRRACLSPHSICELARRFRPHDLARAGLPREWTSRGGRSACPGGGSLPAAPRSEDPTSRHRLTPETARRPENCSNSSAGASRDGG
jgi:hypothetical protein